jgi:hypothetical protein
MTFVGTSRSEYLLLCNEKVGGLDNGTSHTAFSVVSSRFFALCYDHVMCTFFEFEFVLLASSFVPQAPDRGLGAS